MLGYFSIFTISVFSFLSIFSSGKFFNRVFFNEQKNFFELIIFGVIFLSFVALLINFFFSLNPFLNILFIVLPIIYYLIFENNDYKNDFIKIFILSILTVILISLENTNRPDAGLYHLPFINILNESNLIVGITNLHFRFGHISILQYISAIFNNPFFGSNGILIPPSIIFLSLTGYFFQNLIKKKEFDNLVQVLSFIFLSYCLINMNRYSSWGNDDFASILFLICIIEAYKLYLNFNLKDLSKLSLFCSFAFLIKTFFIIIFIIPFFILIKYYKKISLSKFLNSINIFSFFFICIWLLKNYLNSSCFLFPLEFTCIFNTDWSMSKIAINNISNISEAWAKDFPNYDNKNIGFNNYISDFNWISSWLHNHFIVILKNILILIPIILVLNIFVKIKYNKIQNKFIKEFLIVSFLLCLIWFLKFPLLRFGEGFLVTLITLSFLYIKINKINFKNYKSFNKIFISILIIIIIGKNGYRIFNNYEYLYVDYPWPKKNSYSDTNKLNEYVGVIENDKIIYYKSKNENNLCMYGKAPCAAIGVNKYFFKNLKMEIHKDKFLIFDRFVISNK